jgi:hypothetical protein
MTRGSYRRLLRALFKPLLIIAAVIYFLIDLLLLAALRPFLKRFSDLRLFQLLARWIASLGPYTTLGIFLIPLILFEPVKPLGGYLIATGHILNGVLILALGEVLKIVVLERLFHVAKPKLMSIELFSTAYMHLMDWWNWMRALPPWRAVQRAAVDIFRSMKQISRRTHREFRLL